MLNNAKRANTFTDAHGNKGKLGSIVYPSILGIGKEMSNEDKKRKSRVVIDIFRSGAAGTRLKFDGVRGNSNSKDYIIFM